MRKIDPEIIDWWESRLGELDHNKIAEVRRLAQQFLDGVRTAHVRPIRKLARSAEAMLTREIRKALKQSNLREAAPGQFVITIRDKHIKRLSIMKVACDISSWRQRDLSSCSTKNCDADKEAWAQKFDEAAAMIRRSKEAKQ
mgnify:CR=1 FL=1